MPSPQTQDDPDHVCTFFLTDAEATRRLGEALGLLLPAGTVLLLEGNLGSGKTTLTQGIGAGLGIADAIVSPTFTLICEYLEGRIPLYHLDLYRLEPGAVESLNLETYWQGEEVEPGLMAIEWPDRLTYRPDRYFHLTLEDAFGPGLGPEPVDSEVSSEVSSEVDWERDRPPSRRAILKLVGGGTLECIKIQQMLADLGSAPGQQQQNPL